MRKHSTRLSQEHDEPEDDTQHTAARDYPELGSVLDDRPDPGRQITVIGMRRTAARGDHIYHGFSVALPAHVHDVVHNPDLPEHVRGFHLARHLLTNHPGSPGYPHSGDLLGQDWHRDSYWAARNAEAASGNGRTPYVLMAREPHHEHVLSDEDRKGHPVLLHAGAPVQFTGLYWHHPEHQDPDSPHAGEEGELHFPEPITSIASLQRTAAAYGTEDDARNGEYNGGEGGTGLYWAEPASQDWKEEHLGPQEEAPPPPWMPPAMAMLAAIEEAQGLIGMSHHATTINGTQIDDHGDAPEHGTVPRAASPDSYDSRSTEGDGDPKWADPADPRATEDYNGATVGMYPEGMSAGGGPGLSIGPFTARVPWTPRERGTLHTWQDVPPSTTWGDFVPSATYPLLGPGESVRHEEHGPEPEPLPEGFPVEAAFGEYGEPFVPGAYEPRDSRHYSESLGNAEEEYDPQEWTPYATPEDHAEERHQEQAHTLSALDWEAHLRGGHGWGDSEIGRTLGRGDRLGDMHAALHSAGMADHQHDPHAEAREEAVRDRFGSDLRDIGPNMTSADGYPFARPENGGSAAYLTPDDILGSREMRPPPPEHWRQKDIDVFRRRMNALNVHVRIDGKELKHEHDDTDNSLDNGEDKKQDAAPGKNSPGTASSQADDADSLDTSGDVPPVADDPDEDQGFPPDHPMADPGNWPTAGADVNERSRAYTQGSDDGKANRGAPLAGSPPGSGDQDDGDDDADDAGDDSGKPPFGKDAALAMFTAAIDSDAFRFEFTASWSDVQAKAKRIRAEGHVRITHASAGMVIGEVRGDHDTYESGIQRKVGKRSSIQHWACGCPWATFSQDKTLGTRYAGRPCSHVMALQFEAQARGMFGRPFSADGDVPGWAPPTVVVKSYPPYEGDPHRGQWHEQWRAPLTRQEALRHTLASAGWNDWDEAPEPQERDGTHQEGAGTGEHPYRYEPAWHATAALIRCGEDPEEVGALRLLAGLSVTADQANAPWGSNNMVAHPPGKPYGATSEPDKDMDPGSYGPLAAPDPDNWGSIDDSSAYQMPLANTAAHQVLVPGAPRPVPGDLHWPAVEGWQPEDQGTFGFTDQSGTAGPSTAMSPRDPNGIRMEEAIRREGHEHHPQDRDIRSVDDLADHLIMLHHLAPRPEGVHLRDFPAEHLLDWHETDHQGDEGTAGYHGHEGPIDPVFGALASGTPYPYRDTIPQLDGALAELHDHPEPALPSTTGDDEIEATAAADGTIGGGDAGTGEGQGAPLDTAALGEFGAARLGGPTAMGDQAVADGLSGGAQEPSPIGQNPGMGSGDEYLTPDDQSIQTIGNQQWSGGGADSDETAVPDGQPQGGIDDIVAAFQRSAAAKMLADGGGPGGGSAPADGDIAAAARQFLSKTAEALPREEADELIREGRGDRARNLALLRLEGTHYEEEDTDMDRRGLSLDDHDDDVLYA